MSNYKLVCGNSLEELKKLEDNSVDSIVTDPPYELGFMGKKWDKTGIAFNVELWQQALRVLKPGGHLLAFSGTRTVHRMVCAIEDAGFEIRDMITWNYGSGFPKSLDVSKAIDKKFGAEREVIGTQKLAGTAQTLKGNNFNGEKDKEKTTEINITAPATEQAKQWQGWGTALKPSIEPICVARKPMSEKTVAENVLKWGTGAINIDGCRVGSEVIKTQAKDKGSSFSSVGDGRGFKGCDESEHIGRWPANFIHDGSLEQEWDRFFYCAKASKKDRNEGLDGFPLQQAHFGGLDGASIPLKGSPIPMNQNNHPTVKPTDLMAYLCRLVTPPNGTVLDPFNGSGSTGKACMREGFNYIGIDLSQEYLDISKARIEYEFSKKLNNPE